MAASIELQHKNTTNITNSKHHNQESWQFSSWAHLAWFAGGCATVLISLAKTLFLSTTNSGTWLDSTLSAFIGYIMADLASGIYHWAVDNYGTAKTPIFGSQIKGFQLHHQQPWAITPGTVSNYLHIPGAAVTTIVTPINLLSNDAVLLGFVGAFSCCAIFSSLTHAWAHTPKAKLPSVVVALQDARIIIGRVQHAGHHRPPYNSNYCIVSGVWNRFLDKSKFFLALEILIATVLGIHPRSWNDPNSDRLGSTLKDE